MLTYDQALMRPAAEFAAEVAERMVPGARAPEDEYSVTNGPAALTVRARGAFMTHLVLQSERQGRVANVLYADPDRGLSKLPASHAMAPVGPHDGIGGQHGPFRWADYEQLPYDVPRTINDKVLALRMLGASSLGLAMRSFVLSPNQLSAAIALSNPDANNSHNVSLGEHLYFDLPQGSVHDIWINDKTIDQLLGSGAADEVAAGKAQFWPNYNGGARVSLPGMPLIKLMAEVHGQNDIPQGLPKGAPRGMGMRNDVVLANSPDAQLGMLVWQRPGAKYVCLEPTFGYDPEKGNQLLSIPPHKRVGMRTDIVVL